MARSSPRAQTDITLYRQVGAILREQISDGVLRAGDQLPSEEALRLEYGISRGTLRQALDAMERDGLIERAPGRGTFVRSGVRAAARERTRSDWATMIAETAPRADRIVREGAAVPPLAVIQALGLGRGVEAPFFIRLSSARGGAAVGVKRYLHPALLPQAAALAAADDFAAALGASGEVTVGAAWAEALLAEPRFAMQLKVPLGAPLLSLWWVDLVDGEPRACTQMLQSGGQVALSLNVGGASDGL